MLKKCNKCGLEKDINDFAKNGNSTRTYCKACEAARARENYRKTQEYVRGLKNKCAICGYNRNPAALEFHHQDDNKDTEVGKLAAKSWSMPLKEKIDNEVSKCIIVCANCHREEHHKDLNRY